MTVPRFKPHQEIKGRQINLLLDTIDSAFGDLFGSPLGTTPTTSGGSAGFVKSVTGGQGISVSPNIGDVVVSLVTPNKDIAVTSNVSSGPTSMDDGTLDGVVTNATGNNVFLSGHTFGHYTALVAGLYWIQATFNFVLQPPNSALITNAHPTSRTGSYYKSNGHVSSGRGQLTGPNNQVSTQQLNLNSTWFEVVYYKWESGVWPGIGIGTFLMWDESPTVGQVLNCAGLFQLAVNDVVSISCIIPDMGTAATYDLINSDRTHTITNPSTDGANMRVYAELDVVPIL